MASLHDDGSSEKEHTAQTGEFEIMLLYSPKSERLHDEFAYSVNIDNKRGARPILKVIRQALRDKGYDVTNSEVIPSREEPNSIYFRCEPSDGAPDRFDQVHWKRVVTDFDQAVAGVEQTLARTRSKNEEDIVARLAGLITDRVDETPEQIAKAIMKEFNVSPKARGRG